MFQRLLGKVADDLVRAGRSGLHMGCLISQPQTNGIDRPSFGATIIKTQSRHGLSELEQSWLAAEMLYVF